jgi:hypothetical protein
LYIKYCSAYLRMEGSHSPIKNIFQPGLIRGQKRLPHDPEKQYAYVEHPAEGWRVYMRSCAFLFVEGTTDASKFVVVKKMGGSPNGKTWEPPKGQMEGKDADIRSRRPRPVLKILEENVRREIEEEAHIKKIKGLHHTGLIFQDREYNYQPGTFFQYHIFRGTISAAEYKAAQDYFQTLQEHPEILETLTRDCLEKDAVAIYEHGKTKMFGRWSPKIIKLWFAAHGISPH